MKQTQILFYARKHCIDMEYKCRQAWYEGHDYSQLEMANDWLEKFHEINKMLNEEYEREMGNE